MRRLTKLVWLAFLPGLLACTEHRRRLTAARGAEQAALAQHRKLLAEQSTQEKTRANLERELAAAKTAAWDAWRTLNRTQAAAEYFKADLPGADGKALALAEPSFQLLEAIEKGDAALVGKLSAVVLATHAPCPSATRSGKAAKGTCASEAGRTSPESSWNCAKAESASKGPKLAFCTMEREYQGPLDGGAWILDGPHLPTTYDAIRTAFLHDGTLHVADWPAPNLDVYFPPDWNAYEECRRRPLHDKCEKKCNAKFAREIAALRDDDGDGVESLSDGIEYCTEECEGVGAYAPTKEGTISVERSLRLLESPAPGLLVVEEDLVVLAQEEADTIETKTHLFLNRALLDVVTTGRVAAGREGRGNLGRLEKLATVYDERALPIAQKRERKSEPKHASRRFLGVIDGVRILAGLDEAGVPRGYALAASKLGRFELRFELDDVCGLVSKKREQFGEAGSDLADRCARRSKDAGAEGLAGDGHAKDGGGR
jgi:hypothetical protein